MIIWWPFPRYFSTRYTYLVKMIRHFQRKIRDAKRVSIYAGGDTFSPRCSGYKFEGKIPILCVLEVSWNQFQCTAIEISIYADTRVDNLHYQHDLFYGSIWIRKQSFVDSIERYKEIKLKEDYIFCPCSRYTYTFCPCIHT